MSNWNIVKRQLKLDKSRYLFTQKTQTGNENTIILQQK